LRKTKRDTRIIPERKGLRDEGYVNEEREFICPAKQKKTKRFYFRKKKRREPVNSIKRERKQKQKSERSGLCERLNLSPTEGELSSTRKKTTKSQE